MGLINVNPDAEVRAEFDVVQVGTYSMRIAEVQDRNATDSKNDLKVTLEFVDPPAMVTNIKGEPCKNLGKLFDYVMLAEDKQWKLRQLTEAAGMPWSAYDPEVDLLQREVQVAVKLEEYQGEQKNKVARYIIPTA